MATSIEDQLIGCLKDAHAIEQMSLQMTQAAAKTLSNDPALHDIFEHHHKETEMHARLIDERLEAHGESPSTIKDVGSKMMALAKGSTAMMGDDTPAKLARDGFVQENAEIANYEILIAVAARAGDQETVNVVERILQDERSAAQKLASTWDHAAALSLREAGVATAA